MELEEIGHKEVKKEGTSGDITKVTQPQHDKISALQSRDPSFLLQKLKKEEEEYKRLQ